MEKTYQIIDLSDKVYYYSDALPMRLDNLIINKRHTNEEELEKLGYSKLTGKPSPFITRLLTQMGVL